MAVIPTPTKSGSLPIKTSGFRTVPEALDYAALGEAGYNFYNLRGELASSLPYSEVKARAQALAKKLAGQFERGARVAMVAETSPEFMTTFFACQYAGIVPAPMPMPVNLGGKEGYLNQIRQMIMGAKAAAVIGPAALNGFLSEAISDFPDVRVFDFEALDTLADGEAEAIPFGPDEWCYIQYSSGSTSAPKGVIGTQASVTANLHGITTYGLKLTENDRAASWLPLYHDMGLIGFVLSPMYGQRSVDYIATSDFVRRPLLWLRLMSENRTTITYSPSFGYDLSARRAARAEDGALDLSALRTAGIGGDMVRPEALNAFTQAFSSVGFNPKAFLPSYGMAEATLAVSFTEIDAHIETDLVDMRHYTRSSIAQPASAVTVPEHQRGFVLCGRPLPEHAIEVRGEDGAPLGDRAVGRVFIKGPSVTPGYFSDPESSKRMFSGEWLDTGDMGYMLRGQIVITGRAKDLIIINGRNIWPQDIEWAVEKIEGIREGGVAAFSVDDGLGERIIVVAERRGLSAEALGELRREVGRVVQTAAGAPAEIVLAKPHSMVMTSSGKLSRAKVKAKYLEGAFDEAATDSDAPRALAEARV
ncbi:MAG TPA: fatty acyl-AMP ligase [Parvularculaceae bacterium]|nr:fatty acyl-AMP ligase [Amphiplicatus sp.]MCB9956632.1 fatty acyl-AMP ligase [Caulobacterales bacterium]HOP18960.1 fatty acyl-AMP ligase [Amphiplicatus sp.]HPE29923.1 fatty acyl-AMP ligase [Parvularculaceae bacterium]HRX38485.1 fatty acyl-AMP ligase [Parvularculaceae bacterium]